MLCLILLLSGLMACLCLSNNASICILFFVKVLLKVFVFSICSCSSENYGKTFQDVTDLINNTFIQTEFGIAIGPETSGKVRIM